MKRLIFLFACSVFLLFEGHVNGQTVTQKSVPIPPSWATDAAQKLPPPTVNTYNEVVQIWELLSAPVSSGDAKNNPSAIGEAELKAMRRIVNLQAGGTQALIWMYFDGQSAQAEETEKILTLRMQLLRTLQYDTEIAPSLLAITRSRLTWLLNELEHGRYSTEMVSEIFAIISYLQHQGDFADIQQLARLARVFPPPHPLASRLGRLTDENSQRKVFDDIRSFSKTKSRPYWRSWADFLIRKGYETESSLGLGSSIPERSPPAPPEKGSTPKKRSVDASEHTVANTASSSFSLWSLIVVLIVAALGLLWLLLKRRS